MKQFNDDSFSQFWCVVSLDEKRNNFFVLFIRKVQNCKLKEKQVKSGSVREGRLFCDLHRSRCCFLGA